MTWFAAKRLSLAVALLFSALAVPSHALIKFNDGHDEVFVSATAGVAYDSNLFASPDAQGDSSVTASLRLEYARKAGAIGVNANLAWDFAKFDSFSSEDYANPKFDLEFTKGSGRTTGSWKTSVQRENRTEAAINLRTESWNYDSLLTAKYPVIERYSLTGTGGYSKSDYTENDVLVDIETYTAGTDLLYALNSERDLLAGYRFRSTDTTADTTDRDHSFSVGVNGKIITKLNGGARVGIQRRTIESSTGNDSSHTSWTAQANVGWTLTSRFSLFADVTKDFITLATDESADMSSASLNAQFAVNSKVSTGAGITYGHLNFLTARTGDRTDDSVAYNAMIAYTANERLRVSASYRYFKNWSTLPTSDFDRNTVSLNVSTRW